MINYVLFTSDIHILFNGPVFHRGLLFKLHNMLIFTVSVMEVNNKLGNVKKW